MYDTVRFFMSDVPHSSEYVNKLKKVLVEYSERRDQSGNYSVTGSLQNLNVTLTPQGLWVFGSIAKYRNGDNYKGLKGDEVRDVLIELSDLLEVDMFGAKVTRLDVAATLLVANTPESYFPCLSICARLERWRRKNTLYYENGRRSICFYDKNKEVLDKGGVVPIEYVGKNMLRIELKFLKAVEQQLKREARAADLVDENFLLFMQKKWKEAYFKIEKTNKSFDLDEVRCPKDFNYFLMRYAVGQLGDMVWDLIGQLRLSKPNYDTRLKNKIRNLIRGNGEKVSSVLELDELVASWGCLEGIREAA